MSHSWKLYSKLHVYLSEIPLKIIQNFMKKYPKFLCPKILCPKLFAFDILITSTSLFSWQKSYLRLKIWEKKSLFPLQTGIYFILPCYQMIKTNNQTFKITIIGICLRLVHISSINYYIKNKVWFETSTCCQLSSYYISSFLQLSILACIHFIQFSSDFYASIIWTGGLPVMIFFQFTFSDHTSIIIWMGS